MVIYCFYKGLAEVLLVSGCLFWLNLGVEGMIQSVFKCFLKDKPIMAHM